MKKIMLIGTIGAGKTTLAQALKNELIEYKKTQAIEFDNYIIDTPGEYIENKVYYNALISTAVDADVIALVHDSTKENNSFPPGFGNMFNKEVIGICTKTDLCQKEENLKISKEYLSSAGAHNIFCISAANNIGIEELKEYLELN
ncbi:ethanolamine utilization protein EutP [Clostridium tetani]|uniref:EutP/PduV family microcompartment system protein n=1 Tax=Clostridium tetani TaxID=1513 RepID=UPI00100A25F0|nr:EutP/PduV family microcompartment system protein [Clostridium tetani]RXI53742.1 ethanolamine utilization protein EutP [Clostridium tetani]RXI54672.1 ethanolamine utilization protein EutP [Clostridium tetani]RXM57346.1 ethanolamine utilization protein EutP [Clostridium tetani]RXM70391.1 ethanolamine utilization protein EutP [Clostridium tetani]RXM77135.1 ethanolamine utilization protein EutP [Clostridium tetani]